MELKELANYATECMLEQMSVRVTHANGWEREGYPLPIKCMPAAEDGTVTQEYRPLAILEYVHEVLSGELAKRKRQDKKAEQEATAIK